MASLAAVLVTVSAPAKSTEELRKLGESIYQDSCASCHGEEGQGDEFAYPDPLTGDLTVGELTEVIADTMPEGEPELCQGEDAAAVAAYIHYAFYSEAAQIRNRPPQIALARLTGNQLRQSLADLYARFDGVMEPVEAHGLQGHYFDGERWKKENRKIQRVDPVIDFDFGHEGPGEGINPEEFYIHWSGGLKVDVTGEYEIVVRSTCSFVFDLGADDRTLINNHVQSGDKTEFRRKVLLTGGRVYPLEIDFKQRKRKTEQPPARISLSWVPPHGVEQVIPAENLVSRSGPPTFSLQTELPPDDRSYGYERGIAINRQWDESTTAAAVEFAGFAESELWPRYEKRHQKEPTENRERLKNFLAELVETAFRRPLSDELRDRYIEQQVAAEPDDAEAIKRVLLIAVKSPRFLYPLLDSDRTASERAANRLALTLFDSLPVDPWLIEAARENRLEGESQIRDAARRMVDDYRTRAKVRQMMYQWLNLGHIEGIEKDDEKFPDFDEAIVSDLRHSLDDFLDSVVWSEASDFRQLFQADWAYTTDRLADYYGEHWEPQDDGDDESGAMRKSVSDPEHRFGILTHPLMMSGLAYHDSTSPIHRGVFLIRYVLGRTIRPPQDAFSPLSPDLHPDLTTRERVELQTSPESCQVCHKKINGLGFALENFDSVGRHRTEERGKTIDSLGHYTSLEGEEVEFAGPAELADYLATSNDAHRAFVDRAFQFLVKQPVAAYGPQTLDELTRKFRESGFNIRELVVEIAVTAASEPLASETRKKST
jgi:hypothetical protein